MAFQACLELQRLSMLDLALVDFTTGLGLEFGDLIFIIYLI